MYNYRRAIKSDIIDYIEENGCENMPYNELYDRLFIEDCVTGNASGSYTFSTYQAEENLVGNWDLLRDALEEFGYDSDNPIERGAEWCDVTIRCYLLGECLSDVMKRL